MPTAETMMKTKTGENQSDAFFIVRMSRLKLGLPSWQLALSSPLNSGISSVRNTISVIIGGKIWESSHLWNMLAFLFVRRTLQAVRATSCFRHKQATIWVDIMINSTQLDTFTNQYQIWGEHTVKKWSNLEVCSPDQNLVQVIKNSEWKIYWSKKKLQVSGVWKIVRKNNVKILHFYHWKIMNKHLKLKARCVEMVINIQWYLALTF